MMCPRSPETVWEDIFAMILRILPLALSCLIALSSFAQSADDAATLRVTARLIVLDVVVTDDAGRVVTDLTKNDFTVLEDKRPQVINSFESVLDHRMPATLNSQPVVNSSADLKKIGRAPVTILVMDELSTQFQDMYFGRESLVKYMESQPKVLSQPTTVLAVSFGRLDVVRDFTQDRDALLSAMRKHKAVYPEQMMRNGNKGPAAIERMDIAIEALGQIAKSQMGTPGRKNVIWIGKGFPAFNPAGAYPQAVAAIGADFKRTTDLLMRASVTLYTLDPAGVRASDTDRADNTPEDLETLEDTMNMVTPYDGSFSFSRFAPATGGRAFYNRNDINTEIATSMTDGGSYYTLSYVPDNAGDNLAKYRYIRVVFKRPGLHAMTRDGYYPPDALPAPDVKPSPMATAKLAGKTAQTDLENAAMSRMSYDGIDVSASKGEDDNYLLSMKASDLRWNMRDNGRFESGLTLYVVSFSAKGKVLGRKGMEVFKDAAVMPAPENKTRVISRFPFQPPPDSTRLRFVVRDSATGNIGTANLDMQ
jgi:VWFA-related protein